MGKKKHRSRAFVRDSIKKSLFGEKVQTGRLMEMAPYDNVSRDRQKGEKSRAREKLRGSGKSTPKGRMKATGYLGGEGRSQK